MRRTGILRPTSVTPDGEWPALHNKGEQPEDVFLMRTDGFDLRQLTDDVTRDRSFSFSPDDTRVTFHSNRAGTCSGYSIRVDGSALTLLTEPSIGIVSRPILEPGGDRLLSYVERKRFFLGRPPWPLSLDKVEEIRTSVGCSRSSPSGTGHRTGV